MHNDEDAWKVKNSAAPEQNVNTSHNSEPETEQSECFNSKLKLKFEDNFAEIQCHKPLPDSDDYLQRLERKLARVKKGAKLVESLSEKRQACMQLLLSGDSAGEVYSSSNNNNEITLELDTPIQTSELQRHILPVQAITLGETVNIVDHDFLERQNSSAVEGSQQSTEEEHQHEKH